MSGQAPRCADGSRATSSDSAHHQASESGTPFAFSMRVAAIAAQSGHASARTNWGTVGGGTAPLEMPDRVGRLVLVGSACLLGTLGVAGDERRGHDHECDAYGCTAPRFNKGKLFQSCPRCLGVLDSGSGQFRPATPLGGHMNFRARVPSASAQLRDRHSNAIMIAGSPVLDGRDAGSARFPPSQQGAAAPPRPSIISQAQM